MVVESLQDHEALARALMASDQWTQGGRKRRRIDTHISTVILAGDVAIKFKKPLNLGFLDFVSLEARHETCKQELRLNQRLAPQIYQAVVPITGSLSAPEINGRGPIIDWAVQMKRFDPDALLSNPEQALEEALILELAETVARFHRDASSDCGAYGTAGQSLAAMRGNFEVLRKYDPQSKELVHLEQWTEAQFEKLRPLMETRHSEGFVRECHGDLHLGNIARVEGHPLVFDAIEFNPQFRWIDPISDIAFLSMDLHHRGHSELAYIFLNRYLQEGGDYPGIQLLCLFEVYRALVRAKVAAIRQSQPGVDKTQRFSLQQEIRGYLKLACRLTERKHRGIVITHGVSGSGKSRVTSTLPGSIPCIRVRSDIERKRLLNLPARERATEAGGYSKQVTEQTYTRLEQLAELISDAGFIAVVDATFLSRQQRTRFRALADKLTVPFVIIDCDAPTEVLQERIEQRQKKSGNVSDADIEVMRRQQRMREPLSAGEIRYRLVKPLDGGIALDQLKLRLALPG